MYGVQIAFRDFKPGLSFTEAPWVGMQHFQSFVSSTVFRRTVGNTILLSAYQFLLGFWPPVVFALLLNQLRNGPFKRLLQNASYMPYFISTVVMVGMLNAFLSPNSGIINQFIRMLGGKSQPFISSPAYFRSVYILSGIWQGMGWGAIVYLAALAGVSPDFYEAATIDGASRMQKILHVDIPCIMPTIIIMMIMAVGNLMSVGFEKALLMQQNTNLSTSEIIATYTYKVGLLSADYSSSAAIGLFNSVINFALLLATNTIAKKLADISLW